MPALGLRSAAGAPKQAACNAGCRPYCLNAKQAELEICAPTSVCCTGHAVGADVWPPPRLPRTAALSALKPGKAILYSCDAVFKLVDSVFKIAIFGFATFRSRL